MGLLKQSRSLRPHKALEGEPAKGTLMINYNRQLLMHYLASIAYHTQKAIAQQTSPSQETPKDIVLS